MHATVQARFKRRRFSYLAVALLLLLAMAIFWWTGDEPEKQKPFAESTPNANAPLAPPTPPPEPKAPTPTIISQFGNANMRGDQYRVFGPKLALNQYDKKKLTAEQFQILARLVSEYSSKLKDNESARAKLISKTPPVKSAGRTYMGYTLYAISTPSTEDIGIASQLLSETLNASPAPLKILAREQLQRVFDDFTQITKPLRIVMLNWESSPDMVQDANYFEASDDHSFITADGTITGADWMRPLGMDPTMPMYWKTRYGHLLNK